MSFAVEPGVIPESSGSSGNMWDSPKSSGIILWSPLSGVPTSFVKPFVWALNRVNVVAVTTIFVLHVGVI